MKKISIFLMMLCFACFGVANAQTSLWSEDFESGSMPSGWTTSGNGSWSVATAVNSTHPSSAGHGTYCAQIKHGTTGNATKLITPEIDLSSVTSAELSFMHAQQSWGGDIDGLKVYYRTSTSGAWTQLVEYTDAYASWTTEDDIILPNLSSTYQIAFEYIDNYGYGLGIDNIIIVQGAACPKPVNLTATDNGDGTATVTWNGTAANDFIINIDGEETVGVTSPYTFDVEPSTTYNITVTADCDAAGTSEAVSISFTAHCLAADMCSITLALTDSYGDGWNGGKMEVVDANTSEVYGTYTIASGGSATYELALCPGTVVNFVYTAGNYGTENGWVIYDAGGEVITEEAGCNSGCSHTNGVQATYTMECSGCFKPSNLQASNITTNSATMSWSGNSDSYVLQYRPWFQVGEDTQATEEFVTYTYDLSEFSGMGSIAIRHYDVTDMFYLNVDDVLLTDANGNTLFSEDFESGTIPSTWTNYDVDGDGYVWDLASTSNMTVNGNYGVYSASWLSGVGALTPDNWLIISNVEMGGTFSFAAVGQDPSYPAENFAVYVSLESDITEVPVASTSYNAENLEPGTPYAWQVKGVCGEEETNWVTALFKTLDNVLVFATDGNWNEVANWTDGEGNAATALPTTDTKVRIDADAIVPAGYVAEAGKATINGGSITIKDGGQLKHNAATLWVTMEKEITAYTGEKDHYYFISTPFSGATMIGDDNPSWSHVLNLTSGDYDLYAFDPTQELEWINYEANPTHSEFTAGNNNGLVFKKGYLYANAADNTLKFNGTIAKTIDNSMTEDYTYDAASEDDWNGWRLVGNPFACESYIYYAGDEEANFYVMNATGDGYELSTSDVALAPLTGAFVNFSAAGTVQYSTELPAKLNRTGMLNMTLSQGRGNVDQARIRFGQGHDLEKMSFRNSSKLYMTQDNKDYAVVYTENEGEMPVNFKAEENGTYTLSFNTENVEFGYLHLIDNMTGNDVDLLSTPSYSFEASTTDYTSRFKLVFATGNAEDNFAFYNNGSFVINNEGMATVQVIDINGRIISSESINGSANINVNAATGVYMLRLINGENVKVQKVVVK